ncbi:Protein lin-10 [Schistosoma japonicum]|nr:Protein lin-10 [Schistosoma japonicum]
MVLREISVRHPDQPDVLIHGLLFRAQYMGSTQILCNKQSTRMSRMLQAQEVVNRIKGVS